ncbi:MAG: lipid-A-disaccharide synthase [Planctomycetes bacterium]|nr:lipid-A-disaccharide synthase [Planctomycetota bacterium]
MTRRARIFISVAEDSADVHAASLIRTAKELLPACRFYGLTGPRMRAAGAETLADLTSHAAMLTGVFSVIGRAWRAARLVESSWREQPPDLVILLDSPELHLRLARKAKQLGLPVLYYIAPQTWASRAGRNRQIAGNVDRLACILPFEERYFRRFGINATYVGHPLFEALRRQVSQPAVVERLRSPGKPVVALLPGSRRHVIDAILPRQLDVVRRLRAAGTALHAVVSCMSAERRGQIQDHLDSAEIEADLVVGDNASLLTAADLVLAASGTATLEVAHYRKPMVVMYDAGRLLALIHRLLGRFILKTPHLSLVNILAGRRVVPEFMPFVPDTGAVARVAADLLTDEAWRRVMVRQVEETVAALEDSQASVTVCRMIGEMLA